MDILNVTQQPLIDNSIIDFEYHNYQPFVTAKFDYNDEIRIPIQELDAYTLPSESLLYLEGNLTKDDGTPATKLKLINNAFSFLFREIRYEINGIVIDSTRNLYWRVPHVSVGIPQQLALTKILDKNVEILLPFRSWELVEFPSLSQTTRHTWPVKTTTKLETPRHVVVAFQINRKNKVTSNMSTFDNCNLTNIRVFLNSERYPYNDLFLDFKDNKYATLYEMFSNFRHSYYEIGNEPIFTPKEFKSISPITHIDCSRQKETIQSGSVVMRIEFETSENIPNETTAYCLILHDRLFRYNPLTKIVRQV
ncbi:hypothetical protein NQ314_006766 [Rhamnusium bicolor]|uniref:Double jelly roll-like domain-containing protein n=1 Tax=Rhamnusium bicolor TaxID=1586634 RepID=A0AAV8YZD2_9CUCU|nr:hypothetical protein NQ314_006766 [Rhamnusium bicolor]